MGQAAFQNGQAAFQYLQDANASSGQTVRSGLTRFAI